ncbi:hypothetical protein [Streptomyces sp. NPDC059994]|uniref:hypothetical protein n=1 Tax=Streptomyces sp. NPDC059994 TaxID=3347029 RepID=UPI0036952C05
MPLIKKDQAGSDSLGHVWPEDGAVVEMPHEEAEELLAIPDGGFSLASRGEASEDGGADEDLDLDAAQAHNDDPEANPEFSEVDPKTQDTEAPKPTAKKTAARKTAASKPE